MCLQFIAFVSPPLTISQLQHAVSVPEKLGDLLDSSNLVSVDEIAIRCSSLIRKSEDGMYFEFSHFSVQEFLTNADLLNSAAMEIYHLSEFRSYTLLAMQCLRFLQLKNFERHPEPSEQEVAHVSRSIRESRFYEYAAQWWPKFARGQLEDPMLLNLANSLFQRHKSPCFVAWSIEFVCFIGIGSIRRGGGDPRESCVRNIKDSYFSPLHLAAALAFPQICQSLLDEKSDPDGNSAWGSLFELAIVGPESFRGIDTAFEHMAIEGQYWHSHYFKELALDSNTALQDRIATMDLLRCTGAAIQTSRSQLGLSLLDLSLLFAGLSADLSVSTKLMSLGVELSSKSPDIFAHCMYQWQQMSSFWKWLDSSQKLRMIDSF